MIVLAELKFRQELQEPVDQMRMKMGVNCTFVSEEPLSSFR